MASFRAASAITRACKRASACAMVFELADLLHSRANLSSAWSDGVEINAASACIRANALPAAVDTLALARPPWVFRALTKTSRTSEKPAPNATSAPCIANVTAVSALCIASAAAAASASPGAVQRSAYAMQSARMLLTSNASASSARSSESAFASKCASVACASLTTPGLAWSRCIGIASRKSLTTALRMASFRALSAVSRTRNRASACSIHFTLALAARPWIRAFLTSSWTAGAVRSASFAVRVAIQDVRHVSAAASTLGLACAP